MPNVAINLETVEHMARLSHLALSPGEIERLAGEMNSILHHIDLLDRVDTEGIEPTSYAVDLTGVVREDVVTPSLPVAAVLANAPRCRDDLFQVQAVLG